MIKRLIGFFVLKGWRFRSHCDLEKSLASDTNANSITVDNVNVLKP